MPPLFPILNAFSHIRYRQITNRIRRKLRYRYLYPLAAHRIFPVPAFLYDLPIPSQNNIFTEDSVARSISRERLLQEAEDLCRYRFAFLNLPATDLGNIVDSVL